MFESTKYILYDVERRKGACRLYLFQKNSKTSEDCHSHLEVPGSFRSNSIDCFPRSQNLPQYLYRWP